MLILLPPSEGKTTPPGGDPVDPAGLWLPTLAPARRRVLSRLVALCRRTSRRAQAESLTALGLSDGQHGELARNAGLPQAPAAAAATVYTGVLYEALNLPALDPFARAWVQDRAVVFSGLWGVVRLTDRIPAYRCPIGARLPVLGGLAAYWRAALRPALDDAAGDSVVLDLRSGAYRGLWAPTGSPAARTATLRVLHEQTIDGVARRSVVSHFNKAAKGRLVGALAAVGASPESVDELVAALRDLRHTVEERPAGPGGARQLDLVVPEL